MDLGHARLEEQKIEHELQFLRPITHFNSAVLRNHTAYSMTHHTLAIMSEIHKTSNTYIHTWIWRTCKMSCLKDTAHWACKHSHFFSRIESNIKWKVTEYVFEIWLNLYYRQHRNNVNNINMVSLRWQSDITYSLLSTDVCPSSSMHVHIKVIAWPTGILAN